MSRIVWFHPRPWGPPKGGGDLRTWGLVGCAAARGHEVLLVVPGGDVDVAPPQGVTVARFSQPRRARLAAVKVASRHPLRSPRLGRGERRRLESEIAAFAPDLAVISEVMAWSIASRLVGALPVVADCANVETVLFDELRETASGVFDRVTLSVDARRVARDERAMLGRARSVMAVSEGDAAILQSMVSTKRVTVVPSSVPDPGVRQRELAGPVALFVGTLDYPPNIDAVVELVEKVLPMVRQRVADARLVIVGRRPTAGLRQLVARHEWVDLIEDAPDLVAYYGSARCVVLPIRSGGGTKLKVYEALSYGVPVVATEEAVAGIPIGVDIEMRLGATSEDLADAAVDVMLHDGLARALGASGRSAFVERLSWGRGAADLLDRVITDAAGTD